MLETLYKRQEGVLIQEDLDRLYRQGWRLISFSIDPHDIFRGYHYYFEREERKDTRNTIFWLLTFLMFGLFFGWLALMHYSV